jgi:hypothetical protein
MRRPDFYESQKFTQWWLWIIILATAGVIIGLSIIRIYQERIAATTLRTPMPEGGLIAFTLFSVVIAAGLIWLLKTLTLEIRINRLGIQYRYFPLIASWKTMPVSNIKSWEVKKYVILGYGIRQSMGGTTLNVKGIMALELSLNSGKHLRLGTQKPEEIKLAMLALFNADSFI